MANFRYKSKVLFICNQNQNRSKTAEELFRKFFETKSAGLFNEKPVKKDQIEWADLIIVMEKFQIEELIKRFPSECFKKRIFSVDIPDIYIYNQPELIEILNKKLPDIKSLAIH
ncbi:phosphotyrosine protein phosphatase [Candidatus Woesearchaeota archaeon]|nr:phosphotyrosine protein phosphatase [Candidatus Woesearchaeota archaeon]